VLNEKWASVGQANILHFHFALRIAQLGSIQGQG